MHGTPILNVYGIRELTASFYNAYNASSYPEIMTLLDPRVEVS